MEIMRFGEWFLNTLSAMCIQECGQALSVGQLSVFKKFLSHRMKREIQFYNLCLNVASALVETGTRVSEHDIEEIIDESVDLDVRFRQDIVLLPIRVEYNYDSILPYRRERARYHVLFFTRLLKADGADFHALIRHSFEENEFFDLNGKILELYAEEAFVINLSLKTVINIDTEATAYRMHCLMIDIGFRLLRDLCKKSFHE